MIQVVTDIGSSHIAAMAAEVLEGRQVRVLSVESKPSKGVRYGFVEQPSKVAYDIGELVRQLQNSARLPEARQLCVSLNAKTMKQVPLRVTRSLGFGRTVTAPLVDGMLEECYTKFNQPEVAVYDVIPLCYELDGTRMDDPVGRKGNELRGTYHIIVGNASIREELGRVFERTAAIKPYDYMPLGVEALSAALLDDGEREAGVALVNLGDTTTTLAVYAQGALQQLLVVPLGGRHITHDIQELGISEANAERLKRLTGVALKRLVTSPKRVNVPAVEEGTADVQVRTDFLATIIEMRLAEMMDPIFKALGRRQARRRGRLHGGVYRPARALRRPLAPPERRHGRTLRRPRVCAAGRHGVIAARLPGGKPRPPEARTAQAGEEQQARLAGKNQRSRN